MIQKFNSHGKFLLTGEYLVLKGALALALPLKLGQSLEVEELDSSNNRLHWEAFRPEGKWFSATLNRETLEIIDCDNHPKAEKLTQILKIVKQLNPNAFEGNDLKLTTRLGFDPNWGLGSSSTLISNLARWANVNPYELLKPTFGGSGYDLACAKAGQPIYYQLAGFDCFVPRDAKQQSEPIPKVEPVDFNPSFAENLFFVYQGQKQSSSKEIKAFLEKTDPVGLQKDMDSVSWITRAVPQCQNLGEFGMLMQCHERIIARCIGQEPVQKRFPDFNGTLKSLGAWGGDFVLAATEWDESHVRGYFQEKGLEVVLKYQDLVL